MSPLLVSEGTADDKYRAITRSSYLEFALRSLNEHRGGLAIFGSSLRDEDQHLVRAIKDPPIDHLAISIQPNKDPSAIVERKASLRMRFPDSDLYFFDSTTHPLGSPSLKIVP